MSKESRLLMRQNNLKEKQVLPENEGVLTDMICYLRGSKLSEVNQERVREDLLEMIIAGQNRGENVKQVIGQNIKEICDDIIDAMPKKTQMEKIMEGIEILLLVFAISGFTVVLFPQLLSQFLKGTFLGHCSVSIGAVIAMILCMVGAQVIWKFLVDDIFKQKNAKISDLQLWLLVVTFMAVCALCMNFLTKVLFEIPVAVAAIILAGAALVSLALSQKY